MSTHRVNVQFSPNYHWVRAPITNDEWTHIVLNYIDYHSDEAVQIYLDGEKRTGESVLTGRTDTPSDGRIIIGRKYGNQDGDYSTMELDELALFNSALSSEQIAELYNGIDQ